MPVRIHLSFLPSNVLTVLTLADGESQFALCYRSQVSEKTPPFDLYVSVEAADVLNRKPYADKHGIMYKDNRSPDELDKAARDLRRNANPVVDPDAQAAAEYKGQLFWNFFSYSVDALMPSCFYSSFSRPATFA